MQRQGLVQAFRQTAGRRLVPILQLMLERLEGGEGLVVLRTVVGALEKGGYDVQNGIKAGGETGAPTVQ